MTTTRVTAFALLISLCGGCSAADPALDEPEHETTDALTQTTTVEAESLTLSGSVVRVYDDAAASGGKAVRYYTNGSARATASGALRRVSVRARGAQCAGAPVLDVYVDGAKMTSHAVSATTYTDYAVNVSLSEGSHVVELR